MTNTIEKIEDIEVTAFMEDKAELYINSGMIGQEYPVPSSCLVDGIKAAIQASTQIADLIAENKRLREENEWQPIETAPKNGDWIIVWAKGTYSRQVGFSKELQQWVVERVNGLSVILDFEPTLWRPLPQPPKDLK